MTIVEFLEREKIDFSMRERGDFGQLVYNRAKKEDTIILKKNQKEGRFKFCVNDYPDYFEQKMLRILKQYQFILKNKKQ